MQKQFRLLIVSVNVLLGVIYVVSSYFFWQELNNWYYWSMQTTWKPFYVYPHRIPNLRELEMPVHPMLNLPFIIFCITIITNCILLTIYYIIPKLQQRKKKSLKMLCS